MRILIEGDHNDGDYISEVNNIKQERLDEFMPLIKAIKAKNGQWGDDYSRPKLEELYPQFFDKNEDYDPEDEDDYEYVESNLLENFFFYLPNAGGGHIHTITKIEIYPCEPTRLL
jgi:hypothetical protein